MCDLEVTPLNKGRVAPIFLTGGTQTQPAKNPTKKLSGVTPMKKLNILILNTIGLAGFFVLTFGAPSLWAQTGVDNNTVFELDGNTQNNPALTGLDWESTFPPGTPLTAHHIEELANDEQPKYSG